MVAIIDYDAGNIRSVENAMKFLGQAAILTRDASTILGADHIILPGVGAFGDAMERLHAYGLVEPIREAVQRKIPFLGICLGLQLLFEESEESPGVEGLSLLPGKIVRFPDQMVTKEKAGFTDDGTGSEKTLRLKVPEIGWNQLTFPRQGRLFAGVPEGSYVYFVHSYYLKATDRSIVTAQSGYGVTFDASVEKDNLFACQFHPEKSERVGMQILKNFLAVSNTAPQ